MTKNPIPPNRSESDPFETVSPNPPQPETTGPLETASFVGGEAHAALKTNAPLQSIGRYRVERILGEGGFGSVFLAYDDELKRSVAIKVPHRNLVAQPKSADRYRAEAQALARLDHPNIVHVHDVGKSDDGLPFVVSKFIEGQDLAQRLKSERFSFRTAADLVATIAEALHYAHGQGLVHRDIKPGNILIDAKGKPFIVDFGLALREEDFGKSSRYAGTPAYMSPEQARGEGHYVDGRSDIFSLGVVFYELLTGRRPFSGQIVSEILEQVTSVEARPPRQVNDEIPKELERICLKALSKKPTERYTTAKDMAEELRHFLSFPQRTAPLSAAPEWAEELSPQSTPDVPSPAPNETAAISPPVTIAGPASQLEASVAPTPSAPRRSKTNPIADVAELAQSIFAAVASASLRLGAASLWTWRRFAARKDVGDSLILKRLKLAAWGTLFLFVSGGLCYYLFFLPTRLPLIAAAITDYAPLIPPNALAVEDVAGLGQTNRSNMEMVGIPKELSTGEAFRSYLRKQLDQVVPGGPGKKTVLIYLSAHGVLDELSRPCLLFTDSQPRDSDTWLPLADLLKDLRDHERLQKLEAKKLLILDCGRIPSNWRMGILYNGFADSLAQAVEDVQDPNLVVLNAAGPGQTSYAAPELGGSVFGHFLAEGLEGRADHDGDRRIMLQELRRFLAQSVNQWTTDNRADHQQPLLIPASADFPLVFAGTKQRAPAAPLSIPESQRTALATLWKKHEELRGQRAFRRNPVDWADLEQRLTRLEDLSLAGSVYTDDFDSLHGDIEGLLREFTPPVPAEAVALSLPLREAWSGAASATPAAAKPFSQWREARATARPGEVVPAPFLEYSVAANSAWQWLLEAKNNAQQRDVTDALQFVGGAIGRGDADVIEMHFLKMLDAYLDGPDAATRIATAIRVRDLAERAAAPSDERTLYWVQSLVDAADARRRLAEDQLFVGDPASLRTSDESWKQLLSAESESSPYATALRTSRQVAEAYQLRDEAWSRIPSIADWLVDMRRETSASALDGALFKLIRSTHELGVALDAGSVGGGWTPAMQDSFDEVRKALGQLDKAYADRCDYLWVEAGDNQETMRGIARALRVPLLTGEKRNHLRDKMLRVMFAHREVGAVHGTIQPNAVATSAAGIQEDAAWLAQLTADEHVALAILDRAQLNPHVGWMRPARRFQGVDAKGKSSWQLRRDQVDSLAAQGGEVRAILSHVRTAKDRLVDESNRFLAAAQPEPPAVTRSGFSQADRLVRAAAGLLAKRTWENSADDPSRLLQNADWHFALLWHCARALDDFWGPAGATYDSNFFVIAANSALNSARGLCRNAASLRYAKVDLRKLLERRKAAASAGPQAQGAELVLGKANSEIAHRLTLFTTPDLPLGEAAVFLKVPGRGGTMLTRRNANQEDIRRSAAPISAALETTSLDYFLRQDPALEKIPYLEAATLYRGHFRTLPFRVSRAPKKEGQD